MVPPRGRPPDLVTFVVISGGLHPSGCRQELLCLVPEGFESGESL